MFAYAGARTARDRQGAARVGPPGGSGHVGLDRGLLYESKPFQVVGHEGPALCDPDVAPVGHVLALLFKGLQVLFHASARECAAPAKQGCGGP